MRRVRRAASAAAATTAARREIRAGTAAFTAVRIVFGRGSRPCRRRRVRHGSEPAAMKRFSLSSLLAARRSRPSRGPANVTMVVARRPARRAHAAGRRGARPLQHARPALAGRRRRRLPHALARRPLERVARGRRDSGPDPGSRERAAAGLARRQPRLDRRRRRASSSGAPAASTRLRAYYLWSKPKRGRRRGRARGRLADDRAALVVGGRREDHARGAALRADARSSPSSTTRPGATPTRRPRRRRSCAGSRSTT